MNRRKLSPAVKRILRAADKRARELEKADLARYGRTPDVPKEGS